MAYDFPNTPTTGQIVTLGSAQWQWDGVKWASLPGPVLSAQRNVLHNPYFNVQQRGTGPWTTGGNYTADRFIVNLNLDTASVSIQSLSDTDRSVIGDELAQYALQTVFTGVTTSGSFTEPAQRVEGVRRLSGKPITVSLWARATSGTPRLGVGWSQNFGAGGSPSAQVVGNFGVTPVLSATWQRYNFTATLPSAAGKIFGTTAGTDFTQIEFWLSDGSNQYASRSGGIGVQSGTVQFWGMQLEIGNAATPLEKVDPQVDLANCQRFCQILTNFLVGSYAASGNVIWGGTTVPVQMRAVPTITASSVSYGGTGSNLQIYPGGSLNFFQASWTATGTGSGYAQGNLLLSADF